MDLTSSTSRARSTGEAADGAVESIYSPIVRRYCRTASGPPDFQSANSTAVLGCSARLGAAVGRVVRSFAALRVAWARDMRFAVCGDDGRSPMRSRNRRQGSVPEAWRTSASERLAAMADLEAKPAAAFVSAGRRSCGPTRGVVLDMVFS